MKAFFPGRLLTVLIFAGWRLAGAAAPDLRIGLIGLDSSHCMVYGGMLNDPASPDHLTGAKVVAAFPGGSADIEKSLSRVAGFTAQVRSRLGVKIEPTIQAVVDQSDAIMLLSVDGRVHLEQAKTIFSSGKPVFIDKPLGGTLRDALEIARLARTMHVPLFSSSALRFAPGVSRLKAEAPTTGDLRGAICSGPAPLEPHHPDLYWYGIHATEAVYSLLGPGCVSVTRVFTPDTDVVVGTWKGERTGVVYGLRNAATPPFELTVFGVRKTITGDSGGTGYRPFLEQVLRFFRTRISPVPIEETVEIMAFMEAADESKRRGGAPVKLQEVLDQAEGAR